MLAVGTPAGAVMTASLTSLSLPAAPYSHEARTTSGTSTLTASADDSSLTGWNVTVESSALAYSGDFAGAAIPAANLSITSVGAPVMTSGQAVSPVGGPRVPLVSPVGTLDTPRKLLQADAGYGVGSYTQDVGLELVVPGTSAAGTYTASLTTTISAGP